MMPCPECQVLRIYIKASIKLLNQYYRLFNIVSRDWTVEKLYVTIQSEKITKFTSAWPKATDSKVSEGKESNIFVIKACPTFSGKIIRDTHPVMAEVKRNILGK